MFVFLFVYGFFNHHGTPKGSFPENFVKIRLDMAEIYRILKNLFWVVKNILIVNIAAKSSLIFTKLSGNLPVGILR